MKQRYLIEETKTELVRVTRRRYAVESPPSRPPARVVETTGEPVDEVSAVHLVAKPALASCGAKVIQLPTRRRAL